MRRLEGKAALLIGATGGIGQACAERFAEEGARLVVAGRRAAEGDAVARRIKQSGGDAAFLQCDVGDAASVQELVAQAARHLGCLDILLNNAGGSSSADGPVTEVSLDEFSNKIRNRLSLYVAGYRFAIPEMIKAGHGVIINLTSIVGYGNNTGGRVAYASAKAAAMSFTRAMAYSS